MDEDNTIKYNLEDYLGYKEQLNESMEHADKKNRVFYNDSYVHAAMVAEAIIRIATRDRLPVKMYCGEFSIFRDKYSRKINELKTKIEPHDDPDMHERWHTFNPYTDLIGALTAYLNLEEADFHLIVEKNIEGITEENVWSVLKESFENNKLKIEYLTEKSGLSHFIVAGNSYRKESSDKEKTAICCFEDAETANILKANFKALEKKTVQCIKV